MAKRKKLQELTLRESVGKSCESTEQLQVICIQ